MFTLFISCDYTPLEIEDGGIDNVDSSYINTGFSADSNQNVVFAINTASSKSRTYWGDKTAESKSFSTKTVSSISSTVLKKEGSVNAPYGIIFLKNDPPNNKNIKDMFFIAVLITSDGKYSVVRFNGVSWKYLVNLTSSLAINIGKRNSNDNTIMGESNKIEVVYPKNLITNEESYFTTNNVFILKINDQEVTTFTVVNEEESDAKKFKVPNDGYNCYVAVTFPTNGAYKRESIVFTTIKVN